MSDTALIDLSTVHATARKVIAENPERSNEGFCAYVDHRADLVMQPHCIAGVVMAELTDLDFVADLPNESIRLITQRLDRTFTLEAIAFLDALQVHADNRVDDEGVGSSALGRYDDPNLNWADCLDGAEATGDFYSKLGLAPQ